MLGLYKDFYCFHILINIQHAYKGSTEVLGFGVVGGSRLTATSVLVLSQRQILSTGNLPQDSAPVCINTDISPEMAAQSVQRNQAFCVTASDWSPITSA